jgi:arginine decarboxylase
LAQNVNFQPLGKPHFLIKIIRQLSTPLKFQMVLCGSEDAKSENDGLVYAPKMTRNDSLTARLAAHIASEKASFHTPGHKGRLANVGARGVDGQSLQFDLTELPGLDDLAEPTGLLLELESRIAQVFGVDASLISVNGTSGAILATMLSLSQRGRKVLVPRNCHRSVVSGLILSGLNPVWYEPTWESEWGFWGAVQPASLKSVLEREASDDLAAVWVVSPTYAGAISEIGAIASVCHELNLPLVVDEAHGTQLLTKQTAGLSALTNGADIVLHSFHKHMGALTQTGALQLGLSGLERFGFSKEELRNHLNLVQSSSPSYLLLKSIDEMTSALQSGRWLAALEEVTTLALNLRSELSSQFGASLYEPQSNLSPFHILLRFCGRPIGDVQEALCNGGIFAEAILGPGVLLMLGIGSTAGDVRSLTELLATKSTDIHAHAVADDKYSFPKPEPIFQKLSPREAFFSPPARVPKEKAIGMVAAQCVAPCPPGWPVVIPGQIIGAEDVKNLSQEFLRVVAPSVT